MKKAARGFTLIECLTYGTVFIFLITSLVVYCMHSQTFLHASSQRMQATMLLDTVLDHIVRDVRFINQNAASFKIRQSDCLIFSVGPHDIGWTIRQGTLRRTFGTYDTHTQRWVHAKKSIAAKNMQSIIIKEDRSTKKVVLTNKRGQKAERIIEHLEQSI